jgi:hypothetical protein
VLRACGPLRVKVTKAQRFKQTSFLSWASWASYALFGAEDVVERGVLAWRTKGREGNEGGIAAGFSVLDSVMLV